MTLPQVYVLDQEQVHANPRPSLSCKKTLSITESAASTLGPASAIWYFDEAVKSTALSFASFRTSLSMTLVSYPQLCGNLQFVPYREGGTNNERGGRLFVEYGTPGDKGVLFITAFCQKALAGVVPLPEERGNCWRHDTVPGHLFCPDEVTLALQDGMNTSSGPTLILKLTKFSCGGMAIALRAYHVMLDAHSMLRFMHDWAAIHRANIRGAELPHLTAIFEPRRLAEAAENAIMASPSDDLIAVSRALPIHRFDWWASSEGCPDVFRPWTQMPQSLAKAATPERGERIPWETWDMKTLVSHYRLHFTAKEIDSMYQAALLDPADVPQISRLDALQAYLWCLISRARNYVHDNKPVYWNYAFDLRSRFHQPLGEDFIGNPMCLAYAEITGQEAATPSLVQIAWAIRRSVSQLTTDTIPALIYDHMQQICAQRYQQYFTGYRHVSTTTWCHHGAQSLDFGTGKPLRMLDPRVPDYFVLMVEGQCRAENTSNNRKRWYNNRVDIILNLETEVIENIL